MQIEEFRQQMNRLTAAYGAQSNLERLEVYWDAFKEESAIAFKEVAGWIIAHKPYFPTVFDIKDAFKTVFPAERPLPECPINPQAAELAKKYAPSVIASMQEFSKNTKLPYDPAIRISAEPKISYEEVLEMKKAIRRKEP